MTQKRKRYDKQFKIAAARVILGGEMRAVDLARELGIKDSTLRRWAQEYEEMGEGWPRLAAVIDALHRKVVGWSMSGRMTEKLVADALGRAVGGESPPDGFSLVFHDDQGSQHASRAFRRCLESHGIAQSMSRPGNPWDNALAESFFKTPERELASGKGRKTKGGRSRTCSNHRALLQQAEDALIDRL